MSWRYYKGWSEDCNAVYGVFMTVVVVVLILLLALSGCADPLRWAPTIEQKQAADITVRGLEKLEGQVTPAYEPVREQAVAAADATQAYIGLPGQRLPLASPQADAAIAQAATDSSRPQPTIGDAVTQGFETADTLLLLLGGIAGTGGAGMIGKKVLGWRAQLRQTQAETESRTTALDELVKTINFIRDNTGDAATLSKALSDQTPATQAQVAEAKLRLKQDAAQA